MARAAPENGQADAGDDAAEARVFARRREIVFWTFQLLFWTWAGLAIIGMSLMYEPGGTVSGRIVATRMAIGVVVSTCIHWICSIRPLRRLDWKMRWSVALAATVLMMSFWLVMISQGLWESLLPGERVRTFSPSSRIFVGGVWLAIYLGLDALQRAREAERRVRGGELRVARAESLARANELRHLEAQMNPTSSSTRSTASWPPAAIPLPWRG